MSNRLPSPSAVLKVGAGRGFVIEQQVKGIPRPISSRALKRRIVGTAAHCLPHLPPPMRMSYEDERTYPGLLGTLDGKVTDIWVECLFADPVADVALLGCPDDQMLPEQANEYDVFVENIPALQIAHARSGKGWVLSLDGPHWVPTTLEVTRSLWGISLTIDATFGGMSGSPILNAAGNVVGIVTCGSETTTTTGETRHGRAYGQVVLRRELPAWVLY